MKLILGLFLLGLSGCAGKPLTAEEEGVRLLRKSDAPAECKSLGKVTSHGMMSPLEDQKEADLKRDTYKLGGDTVTMDRRDSNDMVHGTAYKCAK